MKRAICVLLILACFEGYTQKLSVVGGYFPYWRTTANVNFNHYNYLYFAFVFPTVTGGIESSTARKTVFNSFNTATKNTNAKKLISVGSTGMVAMAKDSIARGKFADTLRKFCRNNHYNGIDVDWEAIDNITDKINYNALIKVIKQTIDTTDLELVITVGFSEYWMQWYDNKALLEADFLQIMIYDQTGTWPVSPYGNHSSMDHFKQAENYWVGRGFSRDKMVMGLPYYGYKFKDETGGIATAITYSDIVKQFPAIKSSDNTLIDGTGNYLFNGVDLIKEKINYAIDNGFKGVFVWEIAQDNTNHPLSLDLALYNTIYGNINGINKMEALPIYIKCYPNPAKEALCIEGLPIDFLEGEITIMTVAGKTILQQAITSTRQILQLKHVSEGLHIVCMSNKTKSMLYYTKILIQ
jgi:hypothetical protein